MWFRSHSQRARVHVGTDSQIHHVHVVLRHRLHHAHVADHHRGNDMPGFSKALDITYVMLRVLVLRPRHAQAAYHRREVCRSL